MKLKKNVRGLALWGLLAAALPAAHADMTGDTVTGSLASGANNWGLISQPIAGTATVGAGAEFTGQWTYAPGGVTSEVWDITVDIGADTITVSAYENTAGPNNLYMYTGTLFSLSLGNLDFGTPITGLSLISGSTGFTSGWGPYYSDTSTTVGANSVDISWHNLRFGSGDTGPNGGSWTWRILPSGNTNPATNTVPAPNSAALAVLALLGLAFTRRRA